jgi:Ca2+-binding RTX toxin-like protein
MFGFHVRGAEGLTVYTGASIGTLTPVGDTGTEVIFSAVSGTDYSVRVARDNWNTDYPFTLFWGESPANDSFADAVELMGPKGNTSGSTAFATLETGETAPGENSVWYTWTAPATGHVRFDAWRLEDATWGWVDTILNVYTGASVEALTPVAGNDDWYRGGLPAFGSAVSFRAVAGTTYLISVDTWGSFAWGLFGLRWYPGAIIFGKAAGTHISGTSGRDYIDGRGGNDIIHGLGGNDIVVGGAGRDRLYGDAGADLLDSRDFVRGNDQIDGGPGTDRAIRDRQDTVRNVP